MTLGYLLLLWLETVAADAPAAFVAGWRRAAQELATVAGDVDVEHLDVDELEALWVRRRIAGDGSRVDLWQWLTNAALEHARWLGLVDENVAARVPPP